MHTDCGIVRAEQGKTRCKRKIGTFMVDVLQLLLPFLPAFVSSLKSFFFSYSAFSYMIGSSLPVSFLHIRGKNISC